MTKFQSWVLYGVAFGLGGIILTLLLQAAAKSGPISGTTFADRLTAAVGKGN